VFGGTVSEMADRTLATLYRREAPARCAGAWLADWARREALTGAASRQGGHIRKWELATYSVAYQKVKPWLTVEQRAAIEPWLRQLGALVTETYERDTDLASRQNNHLNWAVWAVANAAVATGDDVLWAWSRERFAAILDGVPEDALLPLEMQRGASALGYQIYATAALVLTAELFERNGIDAYALNARAVPRLVEKALRGLEDPSEIAARAGEPQDIDNIASSSRLSWLEAYNARFPNPRVDALLEPLRPLGHRTYGGAISLMFGPRSDGADGMQ